MNSAANSNDVDSEGTVTRRQNMRGRPHSQVRSGSSQRSHSQSRSRSRERRGLQRQKEQDIEADQDIIRSLLRIEQAREQPVDRFVKAFWIYKGKYPYDANILEVMTKPKQMLGKLSLQQLEEMLESARNFLQSETRREKFHPQGKQFSRYWSELTEMIRIEIKLKGEKGGVKEDLQAKIQKMLAKPAEELAKLEAAIELTLKNPSFGIDLGYWQRIKAKISLMRAEESLLHFYQAYREKRKDIEANDEMEEEQVEEEPISPELRPISTVNRRMITSQECEDEERKQLAEKIFKDELDKCRQTLQNNLSLGRNHQVDTGDVVGESTAAYDFITQEIIEFEKYKRMEEDEEEFDDWVPTETEGRFRTAKPQYINRVRVSFEWNKYNKHHFTENNLPPKTIKGYKFHIFYPDLYDKQKTPQYYLQETESPQYCIIKFKAGPPYKDIAFKIQLREWDFSEKSGFQSIFVKGILHLYFNYKTPRLRL